MTIGRCEEAGHRLCRRLVVLLTEDDAAPTSVGHTMMVVAAAWFMAAPLICVGGLMDRLVEHLSRYPAMELDGSPYTFDPEQAFWQEEQRALYGWQDDPQEVPAVVVDT